MACVSRELTSFFQIGLVLWLGQEVTALREHHELKQALLISTRCNICFGGLGEVLYELTIDVIKDGLPTPSLIRVEVIQAVTTVLQVATDIRKEPDLLIIRKGFNPVRVETESLSCHKPQSIFQSIASTAVRHTPEITSAPLPDLASALAWITGPLALPQPRPPVKHRSKTRFLVSAQQLDSFSMNPIACSMEPGINAPGADKKTAPCGAVRSAK